MTTAYDYLYNINGSLERLQIIELDLLDDFNSSSWKNAFSDNIEVVIHTASPNILKIDNPDQNLIQPAIKGTLSVCEMCDITLSLKKLIITSCINGKFRNHSQFYLNCIFL